MVDYRHRLRPALRALEQDPGASLEQLASLSCLSTYHFHRVFTAVTGEGPGEMGRRLRLERGARSLRNTQQSITCIALEAGFASSQAFTKAFRRHFGMTPLAFRQASAEQIRKIGHTMRKAGHAVIAGAEYGEDLLTTRSFTMRTEQLTDRTLAYIRVTGPYGVGYDVVCSRLYQWAAARGLADGEWVFIYHDNPEITDPAQCRTDIGVTVPASTAAEGEVEIQVVPAGRYARSRFVITDRSEYGARWQDHINDIVAAGLEFDEVRPCFELYHSSSNDPVRDDVSFYSSIAG